MANNVSVCEGASDTIRIGLAASVTVPFAASTEKPPEAALSVDAGAMLLADAPAVDGSVDTTPFDAGGVDAADVASELESSLPQAVTARSRVLSTAPTTAADDLGRNMKNPPRTWRTRTDSNGGRPLPEPPLPRGFVRLRHAPGDRTRLRRMIRAASPLRDSAGFSPASLDAVRPGEPGTQEPTS